MQTYGTFSVTCLYHPHLERLSTSGLKVITHQLMQALFSQVGLQCKVFIITQTEPDQTNQKSTASSYCFTNSWLES